MRSSYFILTLIVAIPFLISMIILYIVSLKAKGRAAGMDPHVKYCPGSNLIAADDLSESRPEYCDAALMATILKRSAGGAEGEMEVACPGFIIGTDIVVTIDGCISESDQSDYYVTSGTFHWSKNRNVHRICNATKIHSVHAPNENLMAIEVQPDFPACISGAAGIEISRTTKLKDQVDIEGAKIGNKKETDSIDHFQVTSQKNGCEYIGALFYDTNSNYGLLKKCNGNSHEVIFLIYYVDILKYKFEGISEIVPN